MKEILNIHKGITNTTRDRLHSALLTLQFLNANEQKTTAAERPLLACVY